MIFLLLERLHYECPKALHNCIPILSGMHYDPGHSAISANENTANIWSEIGRCDQDCRECTNGNNGDNSKNGRTRYKQ